MKRLAASDLLRHRHALRAGEHAHDQVDLLLVLQALGFVDGDIHLALRIRVDGADPVAFDAAALVDHVDGVLGAEIAGNRAACGERAGEIEDHADLDLLLLRDGRAQRERQGGTRHQ